MTQQFFLSFDVSESYRQNHKTDPVPFNLPPWIEGSNFKAFTRTCTTYLIHLWTKVYIYIINRVRVSVLYNFYTFSLVIERTHPTCTSPTLYPGSMIQEIWCNSVRGVWFKKYDTILSGECDSRNMIQFCQGSVIQKIYNSVRGVWFKMYDTILFSSSQVRISPRGLGTVLEAESCRRSEAGGSWTRLRALEALGSLMLK